MPTQDSLGVNVAQEEDPEAPSSPSSTPFPGEPSERKGPEIGKHRVGTFSLNPDLAVSLDIAPYLQVLEDQGSGGSLVGRVGYSMLLSLSPDQDRFLTVFLPNCIEQTLFRR